MADTVNQQDDEPIAGDLIGSDFFPTSKITIGDDGTDDGFVSTANPMPVAIISGAGSGGTAQNDGTAFAPAMAGTPAMGVYESTPTTVTDGDLGVIGITNDRSLRVSVENFAAGGVATEATLDALNTKVTACDTSSLALESGGNLATIANSVKADDADFTATTTPGVPMMGVATGAAAVTAGDVGVVGMTVDRELWTYDSQVKAAVEALWTLIDAISSSGSTIALESGNLATIASDTTSSAGSLANIDANIAVCNTGAVVIASGTISLPSGASTSANQSTIITSLQLLDDAVATTGSAITTKGFAVSGTDGTNARVLKTDSSGELQIDVLTLPNVTNGGTFAVQVDGNALTALQLIDDVIFADDAAFTPGTSKVAAIGLQADESSTDSVDEGDVGCPRMTLDRKQIVTPQAHTAGGATPYKLISAASTNATSVKASAGQIYGIQVFNTNASARYLKLYDKASSPTVGTDTPVKVITIPGATTGAGAVLNFPVGIAFTSGIALATTTGAADSDSTGVAASEIVINLDYK